MEDQLLETFKYGAEEMRSLREHEWTIANYTVLAYAGLAAIPYVVLAAIQHTRGALLHDERWRTRLSVFAVALVLFVEYQAIRTLWFTNHLEDIAHARLEEAANRLPSVCDVLQMHRPMQSSDRPWWIKIPGLLWSSDEEPPGPCPGKVVTPKGLQIPVSDPFLRPGLVAVVVLGAFFAGLMIATTIPGVVCRRVAMGSLWVMIAFVILVIAGHRLSAW